MMQVISLAKLRVNRANDRHGELGNEDAAITWLLQHKTDHMKRLAADIVEQGQIYETPLVHPRDDGFVVLDGNRRVTCMKLLEMPARARDAELQRYFESLRKASEINVWTEVECQVEINIERADEILFRRHTGSQGGIGQSGWDDVAKANFVARTGKHQKINIGEAIEKKLIERGDAGPEGDIPRSNLNRLLSGAAMRGRVGLAVKGNKLEFTHSQARVLAVLDRIARDLKEKKIVLGDIWDNNAKHRYLDRLGAEGLLPTEHERLARPSPFSQAIHSAASENRTLPVNTTKSSRAKKAKPTPQRSTLIPSDVRHSIDWTANAIRIRDIWEELQFHLTFDRQPNAIAVLLRVLVELATDHCIQERNIVGIYPGDKLLRKMEKVAEALGAVGELDKKYVSEIKKLSNNEKIVSADTLHRYVHSTTYHPSREHLIPLWDSMSKCVACCIGESRGQN